MKRNKTQATLFGEAISNLQLLFAYLLHYRKQDDFLNKQNITSVL